MRFMLATVEEVVDGVAICEHNSLVVPFVAKDVDEQTVAGATRLALETLVGAHHLAHVALLHQSLEGRQVGLPQIAVRGFHVHGVAQGLRSAMYGIMFGAGVGFEISVLWVLHAKYGLHAQHSIQIGVFATCLLATSPTWIAEDVHVWTPECEFWIARIVDLAHTDVLHAVVGAVPVGACLVANLREHIEDQLLAKGSRQTNGLRVDGIAVLAHSVARFAPPVIAGDAKSVDRNRLIHHQPDFLFRRQHSQQTLHSFRPRQLWVLPRILRLSIHAVCAQGDGDSRQDDSFLHISHGLF